MIELDTPSAAIDGCSCNALQPGGSTGLQPGEFESNMAGGFSRGPGLKATRMWLQSAGPAKRDWRFHPRADIAFTTAFAILPLLLLLLAVIPAFAAERAVLVHDATIYMTPDTHSQSLGGPLEAGIEVAILEKSSGGWAKVEPIEKSITGWISDKVLVSASTPAGDQILFGAGANAEDRASGLRGPKGEAQAKSALRLYHMTTEYFPKSPLAGEAFYRAADVRWQVDREDVMSRKSAKMRDPAFRGQMDEELMRQVIKKYPHTKWADLAAYHFIENKLCGDWEGQSKCPDKEAEMYEKYADEHPQSPVAAEALYHAATRRAALIEIYKTEENPKKSEESQKRASADVQRIVSQYGQSGDWAARASALGFLVNQGVPTYGNAPLE